MDCQARGTKVRFIHYRETLYHLPHNERREPRDARRVLSQQLSDRRASLMAPVFPEARGAWSAVSISPFSCALAGVAKSRDMRQ